MTPDHLASAEFVCCRRGNASGPTSRSTLYMEVHPLFILWLQKFFNSMGGNSKSIAPSNVITSVAHGIRRARSRSIARSIHAHNTHARTYVRGSGCTGTNIISPRSI